MDWAINMKRTGVILLSGALASAVLAGPLEAARNAAVSVSGPGATSNGTDLRLPDPHKELKHLSRDLRLKKDQRTDVGVILQERSREINLLLDIEFLSEESRNTLAAKVMEDSDAQIEALLRAKQRRKFDKEIAKDHELR